MGWLEKIQSHYEWQLAAEPPKEVLIYRRLIRVGTSLYHGEDKQKNGYRYTKKKVSYNGQPA